MNRIRLFLLVLLVGVTYHLNAQPSIKFYNVKIFEAEEFIVSEEFCSASNLYYQTSSDFYLFNNDLHNALLCALLCEDDDLIQYFALRILERGAPIKYFEENFNDFNFFSTQSWEKLIESEIEFTFDPKVRALVKEMVEIDQENRIDPSARSMNDFKNVVTLADIVDEYGFPTQKHLGFDYLGQSDRAEYNRWFQLILIHLTKLLPWEFGGILPGLYLEGIVPQNLFIHLYQYFKFCDQSPITCIPSPTINFLMLEDVLLSCNDDLKKEVNKARAEFYLEPIESQFKKSIFRRNSNLPWRIGVSFAEFHFNKETGTLSERIEYFKSEGLVPVLY